MNDFCDDFRFLNEVCALKVNSGTFQKFISFLSIAKHQKGGDVWDPVGVRFPLHISCMLAVQYSPLPPRGRLWRRPAVKFI